jgi:hypothetical protein
MTVDMFSAAPATAAPAMKITRELIVMCRMSKQWNSFLANGRTATQLAEYDRPIHGRISISGNDA